MIKTARSTLEHGDNSMIEDQPAPDGEESDLYGEGFAAVYDTDRYALFSRRLARLALSLIEENRPPGSDLLDLACGAGAGSLVFAMAGYAVSGIDRSPVMLQRAERRARREGRELRLYSQEMQHFCLPHRVDVVTCLFDSLNYLLSEEDLTRVFSRVAGCLRSGGLFVFDMNTLHGLATRWGNRDVLSTARPEIVEFNRYRFHAAESINTVSTTIFVRQGEEPFFRRYSEVHRQRGYSADTIVDLLTRAKFDVCSVQGLGDQFQGLARGLQSLREGAGRMMIVARQPPGID